MVSVREITSLVCVLCTIVLVAAYPDGGSIPPVPGPGLSYDAILVGWGYTAMVRVLAGYDHTHTRNKSTLIKLQLDFTQITSLVCVLCTIVLVAAYPDGGSIPPVPGPGLSYGGIPYGSMSGNVAEFFKQQAASSGRRVNYAGHPANNYAPIEQWLR